MLIDLKKIKSSGKTEENFFFEYSPKDIETGIPNTEIVCPVKINGTVYITGNRSAFVEAQVVFDIKGECTRCLNNTEKTFIVDIKEEVSPDTEEGYKTNHDVIDLKEMVNDAILLNIPYNFLCKEDCKGISFN